MTDISLSPGQQAVFDQIMTWHKSDDQTFVLAGYAGTGKTTLAKYISDAIDGRVAFCAFTGKAANVLRDKGCANAGTLHSWLYSLTDHNRKVIKELEGEIEKARAAGRLSEVAALRTELEEKRILFRKPKFDLNTESELKNVDLAVVDEYSMLNGKLIADLQKVCKKILYIGDPFQLPPVEESCPLEPNAFLQEIHRQALESPIIRAATDVREGRALSPSRSGDFQFKPQRDSSPTEYLMVDQVIVGRNNTRHAWNRRFRELKGVDLKHPTSNYPRAGEKMICLKNNPGIGLFNGMIGSCDRPVTKFTPDSYTMDFDGMIALPVWYGDVVGESDKYDGYNERHKVLERFDYGYAITCHKAQGSEFDSVLVYNEPIGKGEERKRWLYTAITRARTKCTVVEPLS